MVVLFLKNISSKFMENTEIIEKLKHIIKPYVNDQSAMKNLTESTDFIRDLKINSANLVDIVLDVEEVFSISIDNESMEKMLTVDATIAIIKNKLAEL
jgi:acyl carrier protein